MPSPSACPWSEAVAVFLPYNGSHPLTSVYLRSWVAVTAALGSRAFRRLNNPPSLPLEAFLPILYIHRTAAYLSVGIGHSQFPLLVVVLFCSSPLALSHSLLGVFVALLLVSWLLWLWPTTPISTFFSTLSAVLRELDNAGLFLLGRYFLTILFFVFISFVLCVVFFPPFPVLLVFLPVFRFLLLDGCPPYLSLLRSYSPPPPPPLIFGQPLKYCCLDTILLSRPLIREASCRRPTLWPATRTAVQVLELACPLVLELVLARALALAVAKAHPLGPRPAVCQAASAGHRNGRARAHGSWLGCTCTRHCRSTKS